jgi:DNA-binding NtrC family response regulator
VLVDYHSPGNVRELKNIVERAAILADGGLIVTEHLALAPRPRISGEGQAASSDLSAVERDDREPFRTRAATNRPPRRP